MGLYLGKPINIGWVQWMGKSAGYHGFLRIGSGDSTCILLELSVLCISGLPSYQPSTHDVWAVVSQISQLRELPSPSSVVGEVSQVDIFGVYIYNSPKSMGNHGIFAIDY